jgi:hypothetical protein
MPDLRWQAQRSWIVGNRAFTECTVLGTTPAGEPFKWAGCDLYEFEGRKIMRKDTYWKGPGGRMWARVCARLARIEGPGPVTSPMDR